MSESRFTVNNHESVKTLFLYTDCIVVTVVEISDESVKTHC